MVRILGGRGTAGIGCKGRRGFQTSLFVARGGKRGTIVQYGKLDFGNKK